MVDPNKRYTADKILKHPWIIGDVTPRKPLLEITQKIREMNARKRLKVRIYINNYKFYWLPEIY